MKIAIIGLGKMEANMTRRLLHSDLGNRLYYCATPSTLVGSIVGGLGQAGLHTKFTEWVRVIIEKPFGYDSVTAQAADELLARNGHRWRLPSTPVASIQQTATKKSL